MTRLLSMRTRHKRDGACDHQNQTDFLAGHLESAIHFLVRHHGGIQGIEGHLAEREKQIEKHGEKHVSFLEDRRVLRVFVVLKKQLFVRIDVVLRSFAQNPADFTLHFRFAFSRSDHFFFGNRFFRE